LYAERRALITATDAAAMAAAQQYALKVEGCNTDTTADPDGAYALMAANQPGATITGCTRTGKVANGYVTVNATQQIDYLFGPVIGHSTGTAAASSTARWGIKLVSNLRP